MKKNIITSIKYCALLMIVFVSFSVFAEYSQPADQSQNAFKPVTVGTDAQTMKSSFSTTWFLKAGNTLTTPAVSTDTSPTWNGRGYVIGEKSIVSPKLFVDRFLYLGTNKSQVKIGGPAVNVNLPPAQPFTGDAITPLIIDMQGRGSGVNDRNGREAIEFTKRFPNAGLTVSVNTPAIQFSSTANPAGSAAIGKADIIAGALRLDNNGNSYNPVLVATDTSGNAVWGSMGIVTENGVKKIKVFYPGSPVATGQNSCGVITPPVVDLCTNITDTQTTVPAGMTKDTAGNTPGICAVPPVVDLCTNLAGDQETVPAGMTKDTPGTTPGICTVPPVDLCPNIAGVQTTLPAGMTVDGTGNCITPPVIVDLCTNLAGVQEAVPAGMEKDTPGVTPGNCATPVVDQCPNIAGTQATVPAGMSVNTVGSCVTYSWVTAVWGACSLAAGNDWRDFYGSGPMSSVGQSCTSWINSQPQAINNGTQTRNVTCQDSTGLASNLCNFATMPISFQTCTVPLQVRVKVTTENLGTQTVNYTNPGQCLYGKLQNPSNPDPLANMFPLDCQVRTTSQSAPSGFNPAASCFLLNFSGGPGYGFNAGNPGGWTATGSGTWQLQVKPQ